MSKTNKNTSTDKQKTEQPNKSYSGKRYARVHPTTGKISLTKQSFKEQCDINNIINQVARTGVLQHANNAEADYVDAPEGDFQYMMNREADAKSQYELLPEHIRELFPTPISLAEFLSDDDNRPEAEELGLIPTDPLLKADIVSEASTEALSTNPDTNPPPSVVESPTDGAS